MWKETREKLGLMLLGWLIRYLLDGHVDEDQEVRLSHMLRIELPRALEAKRDAGGGSDE